MTRSLRIALVAHIRHPIARPFMGGMEAHGWHLARALVSRGHRVTLFASGDSDSAALLHPMLPRHYDADMPWHNFHGTDALNDLLDTAYGGILDDLGSDRFDVVHNNSLHRYPPRLARRDRVAMVTSLHVPPFDALRRAVHASAAPWSHFTVCSGTQRASWWKDGAPTFAHVVPNGIDLNDWPFRPRGDGTAAWSGRITPTKGAHLAIAAAQRAGVDLTLYGSIEHRDYFNEQVRPHLGGSIRYAGHLAQAELAMEIGKASVFVFTPLWDEPFGLVAAEAMALGLPVAATPHGATAEVVGAAGCVARTDAAPDLATAIVSALSVKRRVARTRAETCFSMDRMLGDYQRLYETAIEGRANAPDRPIRFPAIELPPRVASAAHRRRAEPIAAVAGG